MEDYFNVWLSQNVLYIKPRRSDLQYRVFLNNQRVTRTLHNRGLSFYLKDPYAVLTIEYLLDHQLKTARYALGSKRSQDYQAGDILVTSNNTKTKFTGFIGHAAIVINEKEIIESTGGSGPAIVRGPIEHFLNDYPVHAHFRPHSPSIGEKAAEFAIHYHQQYDWNMATGGETPIYSIILPQKLKDPWQKIYCSKLVWLCYHYGANYTFPNDYLWFSPEDLYRDLEGNMDFQLMNHQGKIKFYMNT